MVIFKPPTSSWFSKNVGIIIISQVLGDETGLDQRSGQRSSWRRLNKFSQSSLRSSSSKLSTGSILSSSSSPIAPFLLSCYFHFALLLSLATFGLGLGCLFIFYLESFHIHFYRLDRRIFTIKITLYLLLASGLFCEILYFCISGLVFFVFLYFWSWFGRLVPLPPRQSQHHTKPGLRVGSGNQGDFSLSQNCPSHPRPMRKYLYCSSGMVWGKVLKHDLFQNLSRVL